jgi:hypothetical protein
MDIDPQLIAKRFAQTGVAIVNLTDMIITPRGGDRKQEYVTAWSYQFPNIFASVDLNRNATMYVFELQRAIHYTGLRAEVVWGVAQSMFCRIAGLTVINMTDVKLANVDVVLTDRSLLAELQTNRISACVFGGNNPIVIKSQAEIEGWIRSSAQRQVDIGPAMRSSLFTIANKFSKTVVSHGSRLETVLTAYWNDTVCVLTGQVDRPLELHEPFERIPDDDYGNIVDSRSILLNTLRTKYENHTFTSRQYTAWLDGQMATRSSVDTFILLSQVGGTILVPSGMHVYFNDVQQESATTVILFGRVMDFGDLRKVRVEVRTLKAWSKQPIGRFKVQSARIAMLGIWNMNALSANFELNQIYTDTPTAEVYTVGEGNLFGIGDDIDRAFAHDHVRITTDKVVAPRYALETGYRPSFMRKGETSTIKIYVNDVALIEKAIEERNMHYGQLARPSVLGGALQLTDVFDEEISDAYIIRDELTEDTILFVSEYAENTPSKVRSCFGTSKGEFIHPDVYSDFYEGSHGDHTMYYIEMSSQVVFEDARRAMANGLLVPMTTSEIVARICSYMLALEDVIDDELVTVPTALFPVMPVARKQHQIYANFVLSDTFNAHITQIPKISLAMMDGYTYADIGVGWVLPGVSGISSKFYDDMIHDSGDPGLQRVKPNAPVTQAITESDDPIELTPIALLRVTRMMSEQNNTLHPVTVNTFYRSRQGQMYVREYPKFQSEVKRFGYTDYCASSTTIDLIGISGQSVFTLQHFDAMLQFTSYEDKGSRLYDPSSTESRIWNYVVNSGSLSSGFFTVPRFDIIPTNVSCYARWWGVFLRNSIQGRINETTSYQFRKDVAENILKAEGYKGVMQVPSDHEYASRVHLRYIVNGEERFLAISGHAPSEMLFWSLRRSASWKRAVIQLEYLLMNPQRRQQEYSKYVNYKTRGHGPGRTERYFGNMTSEKIAEEVVLWHNYDELRLGVLVAVNFAVVLGLPIDVDLVGYALNSLASLAKRYPEFNGESYVSRELKTDGDKRYAFNIR